MTDERRSDQDEAAEQSEPSPPDEPERSAPEGQHEPEPTAAETEPGAAVTAPTQTPVAAPPRRLVRRPEDKIVAGVCSGLAAYWGVDAVPIRIAAVLLAIFTFPLGIIAYLVMWAVMPMAPEGEPAGEPRPGLTLDGANVGRWLGIGAIVLGAIVLFRNFWDIDGGIFWGLLLIGVGVAVWGREVNGPRPRPTPPPVPPRSPGATTEQIGASGVAPPPGRPPPPPPQASGSAAPSAPAPSQGRREPSMLGRLVVGAAALAVGLGVVLDNVNVVDVTARSMFAILLGLVGVGLVIGAWWGRARWLIFPGVVLSFLLVAAAILPTRVVGGWGEVVWQPESRSEVRSLYEHGAGEAVLDLSGVEWGRRDRSVDVRLGFGELLVLVPDDAPVEVTARVQGGEMNLFGRTNSGWEVEGDVRERGDSDLGTLDLDIRLNFGEVNVRRAEPGDDFETSAGRGRRVRGEGGRDPFPIEDIFRRIPQNDTDGENR